MTGDAADAAVISFHSTMATRHGREVAAGLHDPQCEWRAEGHFLCHCAKRRRIAIGFTEPPGELIYNDPDCPRCLKPVHHDGDVFVCTPCGVIWSPSDPSDTGTFTDDYGELDGHLRIDAARAAQAGAR